MLAEKFSLEQLFRRILLISVSVREKECGALEEGRQGGKALGCVGAGVRGLRQEGASVNVGGMGLNEGGGVVGG